MGAQTTRNQVTHQIVPQVLAEAHHQHTGFNIKIYNFLVIPLNTLNSFTKEPHFKKKTELFPSLNSP